MIAILRAHRALAAAALTLSLTVAGAGLARSQVTTVTTDPVGFNTVQCLGNSDTLVSLPFTRPPEFVGVIQSVAGNVLTIASAPGWTANQYVYAQGTQPKHYFALIGQNAVANPKEGRMYPVTANGAATLTVNLNGDDLSALPAGAQVLLIPYWTLASVFPATDATFSFTPSTSLRNLQTQILIPNYAGVGVNLAYTKTYYFYSSGTNVGWKLFGDSLTTDHGDDVLLTDGYFVVRHANGAPTLPFSSVGSVLTKKLTVPLATSATQAQDNAVSLVRPADVPLDNTGLNPADGSFTATSTARSIQDQLFLYDNTQVGFNKAPVKTYYYYNNGPDVGWRLFGDALTTPHGADRVPAGSALIVRKVATGTGQTAFWTNAPTY